MTSNRLPATAVVFLCAALTCVVAQKDQEERESGLSAKRAISGVPTTLATLPHDSEGLTVDSDTQTLYTAEAPGRSGECIVRSITMSGVVSQVGVVPKPLGDACAPRGLEFRGGHIYISDQGTGANGWVFEMNPATGQATTFASGVAGANGVVFDSHGNLWITDGVRGLGRVYKRDAATGVVQEVFRGWPTERPTGDGSACRLRRASDARS